jgi:hypothetical protein
MGLEHVNFVICPEYMRLSRHVLKYIAQRNINVRDKVISIYLFLYSLCNSFGFS